MVMERTKSFGIIILISLLLSILCGLTIYPASAATIVFNEYQLTTNNADQENPDVYYYSWSDYIFVWQDNRNGNWDIYAYAPFLNMWTPEIQITTNIANQISPKIYKDIIVYQDDRNGNWDIYAYNITSKVETQITSDPTNQIEPAIDGNCVVWQDARNGYWATDYYGRPTEYRRWDIYLYNLSSHNERRLTSAETNFSPDISSNIVAYAKTMYRQYNTGGEWSYDCIYYYDLSKGTESMALMESDLGIERTGFNSVAVYGDSIVWGYGYYPQFVNVQLMNKEVGMKNIITQAIWTTAGSGITNQANPDISGDDFNKYVVYDDSRNGNTEIYMYKTDSAVEYRVTNNASIQCNPRIFAETGRANTVVYMDNRNGNWDIYFTTFGFLASVGGGAGSGGDDTGDTVKYNTAQADFRYDSPRKVADNLQALKTIIADKTLIPTSAFDGANSKVKENRRNAILNQIDSALSSLQTATNTQDLTIRRAECQNTINQLNELLSKTDGCILRGGIPDMKGSGYTPDWITSWNAQSRVFSRINMCLFALQSLFENIGQY